MSELTPDEVSIRSIGSYLKSLCTCLLLLFDKKIIINGVILVHVSYNLYHSYFQNFEEHLGFLMVTLLPNFLHSERFKNICFDDIY